MTEMSDQTQPPRCFRNSRWRAWSRLIGRSGSLCLLLAIALGALGSEAQAAGVGEVWTQAPSTTTFPMRYGYATAVYDNRMWVIGGELTETEDSIK